MTYTLVYPPAHNDTYVKATTKFSTDFWPYYATDPAKTLTGDSTGNSWYSNTQTTNQRFHIDLGSAKIIRRIYYENYHTGGVGTTNGWKNVTLWGSNSAASFADLTYATDTGWTQITLASATFDEHAAADSADPKYILANNGVSYRYHAFKIADLWGGNSIAIRRVVLQTEDGFIPSGGLKVIGYLDI